MQVASVGNFVKQLELLAAFSLVSTYYGYVNVKSCMSTF